jgi:hypothetical protein
MYHSVAGNDGHVVTGATCHPVRTKFVPTSIVSPVKLTNILVRQI